ncbi:MAG: hypothetical protein Q9205_001345 [Flavoplaca limonia]
MAKSPSAIILTNGPKHTVSIAATPATETAKNIPAPMLKTAGFSIDGLRGCVLVVWGLDPGRKETENEDEEEDQEKEEERSMEEFIRAMQPPGDKRRI